MNRAIANPARKWPTWLPMVGGVLAMVLWLSARKLWIRVHPLVEFSQLSLIGIGPFRR